MDARLWQPLDVSDNREEDIEKDIDGKVISEEMQMAVLKVYQYLVKTERFLEE